MANADRISPEGGRIVGRSVRAGLMVALLALSGWAVGCSSSLYSPSSLNVDKRTTATLAELEQGRKLYVRSCSSCHALHRPEELTAEEWIPTLDEMAVKAKIDSTEKDLIYKYLVNW